MLVFAEAAAETNVGATVSLTFNVCVNDAILVPAASLIFLTDISKTAPAATPKADSISTVPSAVRTTDLPSAAKLAVTLASATKEASPDLRIV